MDSAGFAWFETPIGTCGIAWGPAGLLGLHLPTGDDPRATRLERRFPGLRAADPPAELEDIIESVVAHLGGGKRDFSAVKLDLSGVGAFDAGVYRLAQAIPPGQTRTYGQLAAELGDANQARAVGQALGRNPWPIVVPCHRITAADGRTGGFSAPGGTATKLKLLEIEGALAVEVLPLFSRPQGATG